MTGTDYDQYGNRGNWPSEGELRRMRLVQKMTLQEIGDIVGVARQAVSARFKLLGIDDPERDKRAKTGPSRPVAEKLPWGDMLSHDTQDGITKALKVWLRVRAGDRTVTTTDAGKWRSLKRSLDAMDCVVAYTRDDGFMVLARDPKTDGTDCYTRPKPIPA